jgi:decaprenylphospho-beta-D-erythro-pentofuranosid-2-ulose 2-reductase
MMDALGTPQSVLVLGGTSEIALNIVAALPRNRLTRVVLAGRPSPALDEAVTKVRSIGVADVSAAAFDALDVDAHGAAIDAIFDAGDIDVVILAFGVLGDQAQSEADPSAAVTVASTNYTGAVSASLHVARRLRMQGQGWLVVISSVAGDRARRSNFVYGSTKAGLDAFAQGLGDAMHGTGAHVLIVRPGFVRTRMTAGMTEAPMTIDPQDVGRATVAALRAGRSVVYAPGQLRYVMGVLKALPRPIFRKIAERQG